MSNTDQAISSCFDQSLEYSRTIDRTLVHRSSIHEVFITDTRMTDADTCLVGAQLPRRHALYSDRVRNTYDPLLVLEICRQSAIAMAHRYFDVPPDWGFVLRKIEIEIVRPELLTVAEQPAEIAVAIRVRRKLTDGGAFTGALVTHRISLGDEEVARVRGTMKCDPPESYLSMREASQHDKDLTDPFDDVAVRWLEPGQLGRHDPRNVVISDSFDAEQRVYPVKVDSTHPALFDHALDHIPGGLLIEACRQASFRHLTRHVPEHQRSTHAAWDITGFKIDFTEFAEIDAPVYCRITTVDVADPHTGRAVPVEILQGSGSLGRATVCWSRDAESKGSRK